MNMYVAIYGGAFLLVMLSIWSKLHTRIFFSPAVIFFVAFFIHTCIDPILRLESGLFATETTISFAANYNFLCILAVFFGYIVASTMFPSSKIAGGINEGVNKQGFHLLLLITLFLAFTSFMLHLYSGAIGESRVLYSGYGEKAPSYVLSKFIKANIALICVYLIAITIFDSRFYSLKNRVMAASPATIIIISETLAFGRQWAMAITLTVIILIISRKRKIKTSAMVAGISLLLIITFIGMLRKFNTGIFDVISGGANIFQYINMDTFTYFLVTTIPGQEVFLIIISRFDSSDLLNGSSYLWNFISRFGLGFMLPETYQTPAIWFGNEIVPNSTYGRDFSMIAESYINFGMYGVLVFAFVGVALSYLNRKVLTSSSLLMVCWGAFMVVNLVIGLRNDSLPLFTRALYSPIPLLLYFSVYRMLAKSFPRNQRLT